MEKQMTDLMQSIQSKRDRLAKIETDKKGLVIPNGTITDVDKWNEHIELIAFIKVLIAEDEKLLQVERQQIEDAFNEGEANRQMDGDNFQSGEDYYKNIYKSE